MIRTERAVRLAGSVAAAVVLTGGSAWALSGGLTNPSDANSPAPSTSTTASSTASTDTTIVDTTTTSTSYDDTTTSTEPSTTTTLALDPTTTTTPTAATQTCKPGWGYGDTNHCHSGPPGQSKSPHQPNHAHKHS